MKRAKSKYRGPAMLHISCSKEERDLWESAFAEDKKNGCGMKTLASWGRKVLWCYSREVMRNAANRKSSAR